MLNLESSEGSSLSISLCQSTSISPLNETSDSVRENQSPTNLHTNPSGRFSCAKRENIKHFGEINNHESRHKEFACRQNRKRVGRIKKQRYRKETNIQATAGQRQSYCPIDDKPLLSICSENTQNEETVGEEIVANRLKASRKYNKKGNFSAFEMFVNSNRVLTFAETLNMLMNKKSMFFAFVTDQKGSRFLQRHLTSVTSEDLWSTFNRLKPDFVAVCKDVYGNYVAQKYLELGSEELKSAIVETLQPSISMLSMEMYGCRVVQKLLECTAQEHKLKVAQQLKGSIMKFVYNQNGNHVVQQMIQCLSPSDIGFVVDEIYGYTYSLAIHPYGSRVIQRLLEKVNRRKARLLLNEITEHTVALSKNQYGNYIIQWIIKHCAMERREIVAKLIGRVAELSRLKFSSNVIEQAFRRSSRTNIRELAEELLFDASAQKGRYPILALLISNQFGHYVIQTLLKSSFGVFRQRLVRCLSKCAKLNKNYGKGLVEKVGQLIGKENVDAA